MSKKRKKKHTGRNVFLVILVLLIAGTCIFWNPIKGMLKEKAAAVVVEKLLEEKLNAETPGYGNAKDIYNSMSETDKQTLKEIVQDNITAENISNVQQYVTSGDMAGLKQYVKDNLSAEEQSEMQKIYEKYKNRL